MEFDLDAKIVITELPVVRTFVLQLGLLTFNALGMKLLIQI